MANSSKRYSKDFKDSIINMHNHEKRSMASLSREYGVTITSIAKWIKEREVIETDDGDMTRAEVRDLKKELAQVKEKRGILKSVAVILGKKIRFTALLVFYKLFSYHAELIING